jgi:hypothetical protein
MLLNEILTAMNCKQMVGGIFCDLHRAFDCIHCDQSCCVIRKVEILWSIRKILQFSKSYLDGRYQKVILSHSNGIESTWKETNQGVPQGSILYIYINDLPKSASIGTKILLYADDTSIIVTSPNLETFKLQSDRIFQDINKWLKINQLILNYNKTQYLQFNMKNSLDYTLKLNFQGSYVKTL